MAKSCLLAQTLLQNLQWNLARINFISQYLLALIKARTINGAEIATLFEGDSQQDSHYRRIRRFYSSFHFSYNEIALLLVRLLNLQGPYVLTLDRTNWKFGKSNINILVLGLAHNGVAFPLFWLLLNKQGNSNTRERIALLKRFISVFGKDSIKYLLADREFIGEKWFKFLLEEGIRFRIRIKKDTLVPKRNGELTHAWRFFASLPKHQPYVFVKAKTIWNQKLFLSGMRIENGEYLIIVSGDFSSFAIEEYAERWSIEMLFSCLKSRGFRFEETHLTKRNRIKKMVAVLAIAFCWSYLIGEELNEVKPLKIKKHQRLEKSIFRYGFDLLRKVISSSQRVFVDSQHITFKLLLTFLSCT